MAIDLNLIDKLLADYKKPEDIIGENGLLKQLTKALLERAMQAEITDHLGYAKHDQAGNNRWSALIRAGLHCFSYTVTPLNALPSAPVPLVVRVAVLSPF